MPMTAGRVRYSAIDPEIPMERRAGCQDWRTSTLTRLSLPAGQILFVFCLNFMIEEMFILTYFKENEECIFSYFSMSIID